MECPEVVERLWEYLDGELGAKEARALDGHLSCCPRCAPRCRFERRFLMVVTRCLAAPVPAPGSLAEAVRARLDALTD
jgi:mycothiol system anti-sigma-R factor